MAKILTSLSNLGLSFIMENKNKTFLGVSTMLIMCVMTVMTNYYGFKGGVVHHAFFALRYKKIHNNIKRYNIYI